MRSVDRTGKKGGRKEGRKKGRGQMGKNEKEKIRSRRPAECNDTDTTRTS